MSQDATALADMARRLRLVSEDQLTTCWEEIVPGMHDANDMVRALERKGFLTSWQASKLLKQDTEGYFLGVYRILYRIKAGTFGRVFRADDPATGNIVAIKVLRRRWSEDKHKVELFEREGKLGMSLNHPNIVRILDVNRDHATKQYYFVMDFVEGGNLRDFLNIRKKLSPLEAVKVLEECANGLAYAHGRGLMHRDIKATNILISSQGTCKLVDFGLAQLAGDEPDVNVDRTVDYGGLERANGLKHADIRTDIFFLGCVFYEMLTGRPFLTPAKDKYARMSRHRFDEMPPISIGEVEAPAAVFQLLDRMTMFDPAARFHTPAQLHETARRVLHELEGGKVETVNPEGPRTVFVVEPHAKLQDALREKLKSLGFRVLISQDPERALNRYEEHPFHALIVDAGSAGEPGLLAFKRMIRDADEMGLTLAAVLILNEDQDDWLALIPEHHHASVLVRPITIKQLYSKLMELCGLPVPD